jgi:ATP-dependent protease ClpP protease subunit
MKTIKVTGVIGQDVLASDVTKQIEEAHGDSITVEIASPGGSVFDGTQIFNNLREHRRKYPGSRIEATITGVAASMASYIAACPAFDTVRAYDNSTLMLHHPHNVALGNFRDMQRNATFLEGLSKLMARAYAARTGKEVEEIHRLMDAESWFFGDELEAAGFVDAIIEAPDNTGEDRAAAIAAAQMRYADAAARVKEEPADIHAAAAIATAVITEAQNEKEIEMTKKEHAEAIQATIEMVKADPTLDPAEKAQRIAALKGVEAPEGPGEETAEHDFIASGAAVVIPSGGRNWLPDDAFRNREELPVNADVIREV